MTPIEPSSGPIGSGDYSIRVLREKQLFAGCGNIHNLPDIFHYWSDKYIRPKLQAAGFDGSQEVFSDTLQRQCERNAARDVRFLSIGAGNCDLEMGLAEKLRSAGHSRFVIDCLDLNETMLERGRQQAERRGVLECLDFVAADFNQWKPEREYDAVLAIQSLHHVVNLEDLFAAIRQSLKQTGCFVVSDMIGRNGHLRWPEALPIVQEYWRRLPPSYRYNHHLRRYEEIFQDWDCTNEGFEGIRSQDILPLLIQNFHFERFVAFGNVIDPFVERGIGHNFDAASQWDRAFIDEVHRRDECELACGRIKPTKMYAILTKDPDGPTMFQAPFSPQFCVRQASSNVASREEQEIHAPYEWGSWPHAAQQELVIALRRLVDAEARLEPLRSELIKKIREFDERTAWALRLDRELQEGTRVALEVNRQVEQLYSDLEARTAWALQLDKELEARNALVSQSNAQRAELEQELEKRTLWALQLQKDLEAGRSGSNRLIQAFGKRLGRLVGSLKR
jgi:SAM-dependent methyltransferase